MKKILFLSIILTSLNAIADFFSASDSGPDTYLGGVSIPFVVNGILENRYNHKYDEIHFFCRKEGRYRISNYYEQLSGDYSHSISTMILGTVSDLDSSLYEITRFPMSLGIYNSASGGVTVNLKSDTFYRIRVSINANYPSHEYIKDATYTYQLKVSPNTVSITFNVNGGGWNFNYTFS